MLTNLYILRQRVGAMRTWGGVSRWLDFHIFCGLMGPTLIIFHTDFKVGGLVSISFWSMIISAVSGIVGRYFYVQLLSQRSELNQAVVRYDKGFERWKQKYPAAFEEGAFDAFKNRVMEMVGINVTMARGDATPVGVLLACVVGDIRILMTPIPVPRGAPQSSGRLVREYAFLKRRFLTLGYFERLMAHWRTFHFPFAVFMYLVSVLHIAAALIFRVRP